MSSRSVSKRLVHAVVAGLIFANLLIAGMAAGFLYESRAQYSASAAGNAQNLSRVLEENISSRVRQVDFGLRAVVFELEQKAAAGKLPERHAFNHALARQLTWLRDAELLRVTNREGDVLYSSDGVPDEAVNYGDRGYFLRLRDDPSAGAVISPPLIGKISKKWVIVVARRINDAGGDFLGVALAGVSVETLTNLLSGVDVGRHGAVSLRDANMGIIARYPESGKLGSTIGVRNISPELQAFLDAGKTAGTYRALVKIDDIERTVSFRKSADFPLYVNVGLSTEDYLADWYRELQFVSIGLVLFLLLSGVLGWFVGRSWRKHERTVRQLLSSEERYRALAEHSPLALVVHSEGTIRYVNHKFAELLGAADSGEFAGRPFLDFIHPASRLQVTERMGQILAGGVNVVPTDIKMLALDERAIDVQITGVRMDYGDRPAIHSVLVDVTQRKQAEVALREQTATLRSLLDHAPIGIWLREKDGRIAFVNRVFRAALGIAEERFLCASDYALLFGAASARRWQSSDAAALAADGPQVSEESLLFADGQHHQLEIVKVRLLDEDGAPNGKLIGLSMDVTERHLAENRVKLLAGVFQHAREGIMLTGLDGCIVDVNPRFSDITGYSREEAIGQNPRAVFNSGRHEGSFYADLFSAIRSAGHWHGEIWNRKKNGEVYPELLSIATLSSTGGEVDHYLAVFSDISDLRAHQDRLEHLAHFDALTHLPNRVLLADRLQMAMAQARRSTQLLAVCYVDLDGFKPINDRYGHPFGDQLLVAVAQRLTHSLRAGDSVARLGGDEFVLLLGELESAAECQAALSRLLHNIAEPIAIDGQSLRISASLGVSLFPEDDADADTLLRHADQALYAAKEAGRNCYHFFDASHEQGIRAKRESLARFEAALAAGQLCLFYQPKVDMQQGRVVGAEALIRWHHPERGVLAPIEFLPVIMETSVDIVLGEWVIREALRQMSEWRGQGLDLKVSVNISPHHLAQENFVARLQELLAACPDMKHHRLEIEVLESAALEDVAHVTSLMETCRGLGVDFSLDDFGTGYSSLTYLKRLPANTLKIDQSFVRSMLQDGDDRAIVEGVIGLGGAFRRHVIAEGVESVEHGVMLLQMGCDLAQGYGIARPMPAGELLEWVGRWQAPAVWSQVESRPRNSGRQAVSLP